MVEAKLLMQLGLPVLWRVPAATATLANPPLFRVLRVIRNGDPLGLVVSAVGLSKMRGAASLRSSR